MKRILVLAGLFVMLLTSAAFAARSSMPRSAMYIGGVGSGCTVGYVKSIYGEPADEDWFEGEGVRVVTLLYSDAFKVMARTSLRNPVDEDEMIVCGFTCTDPSFKTPFGVGVGMPFSKVSDKFGPGGKTTNHRGEVFHYYSAGAVETDFYIDNNGIIRKIYQGTEL